jgi:hypothetical protein
MKICNNCKQQKEETEYYEHPGGKGGREATCKECVRAKKRKHYQENKKRIRAEKRKFYYENQEKEIKRSIKWNKANRKKTRIINRRWWENHKEEYRERRNELSRKHYKEAKLYKKHRVYNAVKQALKKGELIKKECQYPNCKYKNMYKVAGHHPDYNKPLEVVWLCDIHHNLADKIRRAIEMKKLNIINKNI